MSIVTTPFLTSYRRHRLSLKELDFKIVQSVNTARLVELNIIKGISLKIDDSYILINLKRTINNAIDLLAYRLKFLTVTLAREKVSSIEESKTAIEIIRSIEEFNYEIKEVQSSYERFELNVEKKVA
jgi:hypothetical protein